MPYKIEIIITQFSPDGKFINFTEEKWFENAHELTARTEAFNHLWSLSPPLSSEYNVKLYFCFEYYGLDELCSGVIYPLSEYNEDELLNRIYKFDFNIENLHREYQEYVYAKYDTDGEPITIEKYLIFDEDDEKEIHPVVLSINKNYLN